MLLIFHGAMETLNAHVFHGQVTIFTCFGIIQFVIKSSCLGLSMLTYGGMYQCIQSNCA